MRQPVTEKVFEKPEMSDGALAHAGELGGRDVVCVAVDEVLVDLVGEDEEVVFLRDAARSSISARVKTLPRGVAGRVDEDGAGARGDGGAKARQDRAPSRAASCVRVRG